MLGMWYIGDKSHSGEVVHIGSIACSVDMVRLGDVVHNGDITHIGDVVMFVVVVHIGDIGYSGCGTCWESGTHCWYSTYWRYGPC